MRKELFDVSTAFLKGTLEENINFEPLECLKCDKIECLKLEKALYGLKQAPKAWNSCFDNAMHQLNLEPTINEPCVYKTNKPLTFAAVYVDDGMVVARSTEECVNIINKLNLYFETNKTTDGLFIAMEVTKSTNNVTLNQSSYIKCMIENYKMADAKGHSTPSADGKALFEDNVGDEIDLTLYREITGSLKYAACNSRPDIALTAHILSTFKNTVQNVHLKAARKVLSYLKGSDLEINYQQDDDEVLIGAFSDANWAKICAIDAQQVEDT